MDEEESFRMNHAGLVARSTEGHAAKGMKIKGQEDMWITIQHHTFRNWVNVQLRETGLRVEDLVEDMRDGLALVTLIEVLQKRKLKKVTRVNNQHQALENVTNALTAIADDGIKLVNIGNVDIVNGNLKLILGLIWSLIMHYQIGQSKFPPKKLMLAWLRAVLPDCRVSNFTSDWNNGVNLSALLDYCRPGLFKNWKNLNPDNAVENCRVSMDIAMREFNVPLLLEPEYMASVHLDDLSGMTYLSYFMKEGGPGYKATLEWAQKQLPEKKIQNFTTDWNDGLCLTTLVKKLGGPVPGFKNLDSQPKNYVSNLQLGIDGGRKLGVEQVVSATDMSKSDCNHIGTMGYVAHYQWIQARKSPAEALAVKCDLDNVRVNNPVPFRIEFLEKDVVLSEIRVAVNGPSGPIKVDLDLGTRGGKGVFLPDEVGMYELLVYNEDELIDGCPVKVRALPDVTKAMFSGGIDPCAIGSIVEVEINSNNSGGGEVDVTAYSPNGRPLECPVKCEDGVYAATFQPDEAGEWSIAVTYDNDHIQGSPFNCFVYDPHALKVNNLDKGPTSLVRTPFTFIVDARDCGWGEAKVDVTHNGKSLTTQTLEIERGIYEVTFIPLEAARHKIYCYFNGHEVKGTPHSLYLGIEQPPERKRSKKKKKSSNSVDKTDAIEIVKEYSSRDLIKNSPKLSMSNDQPTLKESSLLNKTYESSLNKSYDSSSLNRNNESSLNRSYESASLNRNNDSYIDRSYENTLFNSNKNYESSSSLKKTSTFEAINDKYSNFESSSLNRRGSYLSNNNNSSKENLNELSPAKESSPVRSLRRSSALDSSINSSFNSTLNSSTSTVINTAVATSHKNSTSSILNKSSINNNSLGRLSLSKSSTPSPPASVARPKSPITRAISPTGQVPTALPGLSAAALVRQANQNSVKTEARRLRGLHDAAILRSPYITTIDEASDGSSDELSYQVSSEQRTSEVSQQKSLENTLDKNYHFSSERQTTTLNNRLSSEQRSPGLGRKIPSEHRTPELGRRNLSELRTVELNRSQQKSVENTPDKSYHFSSERQTTTLNNRLSSEQRSPGLDRKILSEHRTPEFGRKNPSELRTPELSRRIPSKLRSPEISQRLSSEQRSPLLQSDERQHTATHSSTTNISNLSTSNIVSTSSLATTTINTEESQTSEELQSNGNTSERRSASSSAHTSSITNIPTQMSTPTHSLEKRRLTTNERSEGTYLSQSGSSTSIDLSGSSSRVLQHSRLASTMRPPTPPQPNTHSINTHSMNTNSIHTNSIHTNSIHTNRSSQSFEDRQRKEGEKSAYLTESRTSLDVADAVSHRLQPAAHHHNAQDPPVDISRVTVSGPGVRLVSVNSRAEFTVSAPHALHQEEVILKITGPGKRSVPCNTEVLPSGELDVWFTPPQVGEYLVDVRVQDQKVPGSPYRCYVYDSMEIRVGDIPNGIVGRPVEFEIDGSSAGSGNLEILVNGGHVTSYVRNLGQQRFLASFVPHSPIRHMVEMRFNGEKVPGSPWSVEVMEGGGARVAVLGDTIKHFPAGQLSAFDISAANVSKEDIQVHIVSPSKRPVSYQLNESSDGVYRVAFVTSEVGSYVVDVAVSGQKVQGSPFIAKAYDAGLIRVSDVPNGVVGQPCQFRVDASQAGEGQLEISINDGEVPNHVQVLGGGRCLVSFTPDTAKFHTIDIKFNGETVRGCPFVCRVADTSRVSLTLRHLELIAVGQPAAFNIAVDGGGSAELTVTVRTPSQTTLPVRVSGSVRAGFTAEFTPVEVGAHTIIVNYNDSAVSGTPFTCKVYDAGKVVVSQLPRGDGPPVPGLAQLPRGAIGKSLQFIVDASEAGEGNLEISISAAGRNIPTQVHPQGSARFAVSFVPLEAIDHIINISFNKEPVQGSPFVAKVQADPNRIVVSGQSLAATAVDKTSFFTISNVTGTLEDVEVSVEGRSRKNHRAY